MAEDFNQKVWLIVIDKLAIGLLVLVAAFLLNRFLERFKSKQDLQKQLDLLRDQTALKHLQRQIEELYSPLLGLIQYSRLVYQIAQRKLFSNVRSEISYCVTLGCKSAFLIYPETEEKEHSLSIRNSSIEIKVKAVNLIPAHCIPSIEHIAKDILAFYEMDGNDTLEGIGTRLTCLAVDRLLVDPES